MARKVEELCTGFLIVLLLFSGCSIPNNNQALMGADRPRSWATPMVLPGVPNFWKVTQDLYRGGQPDKEGMLGLEKMGIKTIINLRSFHSDRSMIYGTKLGYEHMYVKNWCVEEKEVVRFLQLATDKNRTPVFVHCWHGSDRTGTMVAIYRIAVQGWTKEEALREMTEGGYGFHETWRNLVDYVNGLDINRIKAEAGLLETRPQAQSAVEKQGSAVTGAPATPSAGAVAPMWRAPSKARVLAIGAGEFEDSAIPALPGAGEDAFLVKEFALQAGVPEANITCVTGKGAGRANISDAIVKLRMATSDPSETAVLYFSGHGAPVIKDGKIVDAVLVPYDAREGSMEYTGLRVSSLADMISGAQGKWIVVLDACFTGKGERSVPPANVKGITVVPKGFNPVPGQAESAWWLTSTSGDSYANQLPETSQGLFTFYFLEALSGAEGVDANGDGLISLAEAFGWTRKNVLAISQKNLGRPQQPEMSGQGDIILTIPAAR
ncbi:MAG: caspase family protein [Thermodesulfobacteriota bacterium]